VLRQLVGARELEAVPNPYPARGGWHLVEAKLKLPTGYHPSVVAGKKWLAKAIMTPPATCENAALLVTGYSQGAQVAADVYQAGGRRAVFARQVMRDYAALPSPARANSAQGRTTPR
jgi:hypothetical protein